MGNQRSDASWRMTDVATGPLARYYEYGQAAGQRGEPVDACPYRLADTRNVWVRRWHAGADARLRFEAFRAALRCQRCGAPLVEAQGPPSPQKPAP